MQVPHYSPGEEPKDKLGMEPTDDLGMKPKDNLRMKPKDKPGMKPKDKLGMEEVELTEEPQIQGVEEKELGKLTDLLEEKQKEEQILGNPMGEKPNEKPKKEVGTCTTRNTGYLYF